MNTIPTPPSFAIHASSHAKINLFLYVTGQRSDGYHTLETLFCPLALADLLSFSFHTKGIHLTSDDPHLPCDNQNIVWRAADLFFKKTGILPQVSIHIAKHIPVAAGLGGGSSNAATTLTALNNYYKTPLSPAEIHSLGLLLGADVPFFLQPYPAYAEGIGEILTPIRQIVPYWVLLACAPYGVSAADVYKKHTFPLTKSPKHPMNPLLKDAEFDPVLVLHNDLESVTFQMHPSLRIQKQQLLHLGARGALMSGSGPTLFGLFFSKETAEAAQKAWSGPEKRLLTQLAV